MRPSDSNNSKTQEHDDMHLWLQGVENQRKIISRILEEHGQDKSVEIDYAIKKYMNKNQIIEVENLRIGEIENISSEYEITSLEIEKPMYSGYYLQGICDAILTWNFHINYHVRFKKLVPNPTGEGKIHCDGAYSYYGEYCTKCSGGSTHRTTYDIDESNDSTLEFVPNPIHEKSGHVLIDLKPKLNSVSGIIGQIKTYRDIFKRQHPSTGTGMLCCAVITYDTNTKYDSILTAENIHLIRIERNSEPTLKKTDDNQQTLPCL